MSDPKRYNYILEEDEYGDYVEHINYLDLKGRYIELLSGVESLHRDYNALLDDDFRECDGPYIRNILFQLKKIIKN